MTKITDTIGYWTLFKFVAMINRKLHTDAIISRFDLISVRTLSSACPVLRSAMMSHQISVISVEMRRMVSVHIRSADR